MLPIDPILILKIKHFYSAKGKEKEKARATAKERTDGPTLNNGLINGTLRTITGAIKARGKAKAKASPSMAKAKLPIQGESIGATSTRNMDTRRIGASITRTEREVSLIQLLASGVKPAIDRVILLTLAMPAQSNHHTQEKEKLERVRKGITVSDMATEIGKAKTFQQDTAPIKQLLHCTTNLLPHCNHNLKSGGNRLS